LSDYRVGIEREPLQERIHARVEVPSVGVFELVLHVLQTLEIRGVRLVSEAVREAVVLSQHVAHRSQSCGYRRIHGCVCIELRLLLDESDPQSRLPPRLTLVERLAAGQHSQKAALAGAVAAYQRNTLAGVQRQVGAIEQRHVAVSEAGLV
jgi:hypothetical protein